MQAFLLKPDVLAGIAAKPWDSYLFRCWPGLWIARKPERSDDHLYDRLLSAYWLGGDIGRLIDYRVDNNLTTL